MGSWLNNILFLLLLSNVLLASSRRLSQSVKLIAWQGALIACLPPLIASDGLSSGPLLFAAVVFALKAVLVPWLLIRAIRIAEVQNDQHPYLSHTLSGVIVAVAFIGARILSQRLPLPVPPVSNLIVPVAFLSIFAGLFLTVSRRQAISQVLGYLQMENGIFIFGMAHSYGHSFLVEVAVLLDVFAAVMVMGIAIYQINSEFDHIDTAKLSVLRDYKR